MSEQIWLMKKKKKNTKTTMFIYYTLYYILRYLLYIQRELLKIYVGYNFTLCNMLYKEQQFCSTILTYQTNQNKLTSFYLSVRSSNAVIVNYFYLGPHSCFDLHALCIPTLDTQRMSEII